MIKDERYGGGSRWYCTTCDERKNEYGRVMITWTNSTPPTFCNRCENDLRSVAFRAIRKLREIYGWRFSLPGANEKIADLVREHRLSSGLSPHRVAAAINQLERA